MESYLLKIETPNLYFTGNQKLTVSQDLTIKKGLTVIYGPNGAGKSLFVRILEKGRNFRTNKITSPSGIYPFIKIVEFHDIHSFSGMEDIYYQQRYEASMNQDVPYIKDIMGHILNTPEWTSYSILFNIGDVKNKKVNYLSSGETRKLLIINALIEHPDILILDNPYIGLDKESKSALDHALRLLIEKGQSVILVLPEMDEIPVFTDHLLNVRNSYVSTNFNQDSCNSYQKFPFIRKDKKSVIQPVIELKDCSVRFGSKILLENLTFTIKEGERWCITGPNGSGKSTLLSLINADNPQGYCNNIKLFGKQRGSGESIWDIKSRIGYVSPEMQLHFRGSGTVLQVIANGLNDTVGLYIKPTSKQIEEARKWLLYFNIQHLEDRRYSTLSAGERQLVLIARSLIKQPQLLILDEPMHALDKHNRKLVLSAINDFLDSHPMSTFIMVTHDLSELPDSITNRLTISGNRLQK